MLPAFFWQRNKDDTGMSTVPIVPRISDTWQPCSWSISSYPRAPFYDKNETMISYLKWVFVMGTLENAWMVVIHPHVWAAYSSQPYDMRVIKKNWFPVMSRNNFPHIRRNVQALMADHSSSGFGISNVSYIKENPPVWQTHPCTWNKRREVRDTPFLENNKCPPSPGSRHCTKGCSCCNAPHVLLFVQWNSCSDSDFFFVLCFNTTTTNPLSPPPPAGQSDGQTDAAKVILHAYAPVGISSSYPLYPLPAFLTLPLPGTPPSRSPSFPLRW